MTPDGSVWPGLGLEGKTASPGTRVGGGGRNLYKTKPWVCLCRGFTPGRFAVRAPEKKVGVLRSVICTAFETGHRRSRLGQGIKHWMLELSCGHETR